MKKIISFVIFVILLSFGSVFSYTPNDKDKKTLESFQKSLKYIKTVSNLEKLSQKINRSKNILKNKTSWYYILNEEYKLVNSKILLIKIKENKDKLNKNEGTKNKIQNKEAECKKWMTEITLSNWQVWSCLNLWATTVWDWITQPTNCAISPSNCNSLTWLWDYYQWWRNEPINTTTRIATYSGTFSWLFWHNNFVLWWGLYWDWWQNETWSGSITTRWTWINPQWPCSTWRHVPSKDDWQTACNNILWTTCVNSMAYNSLIATTLKLPLAGYRNWENSYYDGQSGGAYYWSSTPYSAYAHAMIFGIGGGIGADSTSQRAQGLSIRCIKN